MFLIPRAARALLGSLVLAAAAAPALAQDTVTLKVHHFLPAGSTAHGS